MTEELLKDIVGTAAEAFGAPSLSVSVIRKGERFGAAFGCTERSLFQTGEITKTFLSKALRDAVPDTGKPVSGYSAWFGMVSDELTENVTLDDIMLQRTGLPPHEPSWFFNPQLKYRELAEKIRFLDTAFGFRERWCRQDHLFTAAGCVLEDVTGMSWDMYCRGRVIRPAGLSSTFCTLEETYAAGYEDIAVPHMSSYGRPAEVSLWMTDLLAGGGSMLSCTSDLAAWTDKAAADPHGETIPVPGGELLGFPPVAAGMRDIVYTDGWFAAEMLGTRFIFCSGKVGGSAVLIGRLPEKDFSFAAAAGIGGNFCTEAVGYALCEQVIRGEQSDWNMRMSELGKAVEEGKRVRNSGFLRACTDDVFPSGCSGIYVNEGYGEIELSEEYGRLFLTVFGLPMRIYRTGGDICVLDATQLLGYALPCRVDGKKAEILFEPECSSMVCFTKI